LNSVRLSIVIPIYKSYSTAVKAIKSCLVDGVYEILVIDDTPNKLSFARLSNQFLDYKNVFFFSNRVNRGVTFSRNRGFFEANGTHVLFLDSDDIFCGESVSKIIGELENNLQTHCVLFSSGVHRKDIFDRFGKWPLLLRNSNSGERTVCVKKKAGKPFIGILRGHELAGLARLGIRSSGYFYWSNIQAREYHESVEGSLSSQRLSSRRSRLISKGHFLIAFWLAREYSLFLAMKYLLKGFMYAGYSLWNN